MNFTIYCNKKHSDNENIQCVSFDLRETVLLDVKQSSPPHPPPLPDCLLNCLFRRRSKKTQKRRITGLCGWEFTGDRWISRAEG